MKEFLVHNISVVRQYAIKMYVEMAPVFGFRLFSTDIPEAYYIPNVGSLNNDIFIDTPK